MGNKKELLQKTVEIVENDAQENVESESEMLTQTLISLMRENFRSGISQSSYSSSSTSLSQQARMNKIGHSLKTTYRQMKILQSKLVGIYYRTIPLAYETEQTRSNPEDITKYRQKDINLAKELLEHGTQIKKQIYETILEIPSLGLLQNKSDGCIRWSRKNLTALSYQIGTLNAFLAFPCLCAFPGRNMKRKMYCRTNCSRNNIIMTNVFATIFWPEITRVLILLEFFFALEALYLLIWSLSYR